MQGAGLGRGFIFLLETCWSISITLNLCLRAKAASPRSPFPSGSPGAKAACTVRDFADPSLRPGLLQSLISRGSATPEAARGLGRDLRQGAGAGTGNPAVKKTPACLPIPAPRLLFLVRVCVSDSADPAGQPLPASSCQTPQPRAAPRHEPPATGPTYIHLRDATPCAQLLLSLPTAPAAPAGSGSPKQQLWHLPSCLLSPSLDSESQQKVSKILSG